jgi:hypothetical protein
LAEGADKSELTLDYTVLPRVFKLPTAAGAFTSRGNATFRKCCFQVASRDAVLSTAFRVLRFWDNQRVTPEAMLDGHIRSAIERIKKHDCVLLIQDTTNLDFAHHPSTKGLGTWTI